MNVQAVLHIPTLHGKIFEGIFPMWKWAKLLPSKQTKSNLTFTIYCPNFGVNYSAGSEATKSSVGYFLQYRKSLATIIAVFRWKF
ncbi:hypothetical protein [Chryseobacterium mulctrae]|uniref:hypothetical protein n=1 Tax=Chryseobacterium mulctrae TaxID=2576777 RepID=UPI001115C127|nr:hypothetical protein [Chryseobacterium mulctrae]